MQNWYACCTDIARRFLLRWYSAVAAAPAPGQRTGFSVLKCGDVEYRSPYRLERWIPSLRGDISDCGVMARVGLAVHCGSPNSCIISKPVARRQRVAVAAIPRFSDPDLFPPPGYLKGRGVIPSHLKYVHLKRRLKRSRRKLPPGCQRRTCLH